MFINLNNTHRINKSYTKIKHFYNLYGGNHEVTFSAPEMEYFIDGPDPFLNGCRIFSNFFFHVKRISPYKKKINKKFFVFSSPLIYDVFLF